ncbi:Glycogen synthase kinase-3 beta [Takifugu flavidus]|uniref:Glycogen synthase kinase-3 beta n=1 Tax=Takifugu flavidus TaxID=433684 RepID=A0A5C6PRR3_9TELE|nr:Glycogen synthase kinase-3 beta [Takifugu flavidus]
MSGRPRTTSFAESCKPVPQPSAFGSMKVSTSMTLAGSLALSYLCHWLRLAPAECNARDEHTPLHCAPPWSAWRGLAGRAGAGPGRAGPGRAGEGTSVVETDGILDAGPEEESRCRSWARRRDDWRECQKSG